MAGTAHSRLQASRKTLLALATGLTRFGPAEGSDAWPVPFAWLCTKDAPYIASAMIDGLCIEPLASFLARLRDDVERIGGNAGLAPLPAVPDAMSPPPSLRPWSGEVSDVEVIRTSAGAAGLVFTGSHGANLLVARDSFGPAVILATAAEEVAKLLEGSQRNPLADHLLRSVRP